MKSLHTSLNTAHAFMVQPKQFQVILHPLSPSLPAPSHTSHPVPLPDFTTPTPNQPHLCTPNVLTTLIYLICHASPRMPHSENPKDCTLDSSLRFLSCNDTPHIHLTLIYVSLTPVYVDFLPSLLRSVTCCPLAY